MKIHSGGAETHTFPRLVGKLGDRQVVIELGEQTSLGRHSESDLVLNDKDVSKRHCVITRRDGVFWVHDAGSTNGVFVNGHKVADEALWAGDWLAVGRSGFWFLDGEAPSDAVSRGQATIVIDGTEASLTVWFDGSSTVLQFVTPREALAADALKLKSKPLPDSVRVAKKLVGDLVAELGVDSVELFIRSPLGIFESRASVSARGDERATFFSPGLVERIAHKRRAVISNDLRRDTPRLLIPFDAENGPRAALGIPLLENREVVAVLVASSGAGEKRFGLTDARLAQRALIKLGARLLPLKPGVN